MSRSAGIRAAPTRDNELAISATPLASATPGYEGSMAFSQQNIWVVNNDNEDWQVRREGSDEVISAHSTQEEAHDAGRQIAGRDQVELIIQGRDGKIVEKHSFGNDPRDIPG